MANIYDVAKEAGVSTATVSYAINGKRNLKPETIEKVNNAIKKLNYKPNKVAQSLAMKTTNLIGVLVSDISNHFFAPIVRGIEDYADEAGYIIMVGNSDENWEKAEKYLNTLVMHRVEGLIVSPTSDFNKLENKMKGIDIPIVLINRVSDMLNCSTVESDNRLGGVMATNHLLEMGHTKIAAMIGPTSVSTHVNRLKGYMAAMREKGIAVDEELIYISPNHNEAEFASRAIKKLLKKENRPTAIFSSSGILTLGIIRALNELSVKIPEEISIVSFDETEWAPLVTPPLTTVSQKTYEMGRAAAKVLLSYIDGKKGLDPTSIKLKPELIIRESVSYIGK